MSNSGTTVNGSLKSLPAELRERDQWVLAGPDKKPLTIHGTLASVTDPSTWTDFETACRVAAERGLHIGFVLTASDPYCCIDFDVINAESQARKGQPIDPTLWTTAEQMTDFWAYTQQLDTYTEQSLNGGLHIWLCANAGKGRKRANLEFYSQERYILCTGNVLIDKPIADRTDEVTRLLANMGGDEQPTVALVEFPPELEDDELLAKARAAANADKFNQLWEGDWKGAGHPSQSEADYALLSLLTFWTRSNEQVRRLFRQSSLGQRKKAQRNDYLNDALAKLRGQQAIQREKLDKMAEGMAPAIDALLRQEQRYQFRQIGEGEIDIKALHPPTMDLPTMLSSLVLVSAEKTLVAFRDKPTISLATGGMRTLLSHNWTKVKKGQAPTFDLWLQDQKKITAYTITFDPRAGEFCKSPDQRLALNLWRPRPHNPPAGWKAGIKPFLDHLAYLVPERKEREGFLDWLAHIEQMPGELPHAHYLMIATSQGVGRGWLSALLACVWSGHVALDFDLKQSLHSGFNGQLSRKLLAVVDEINEGGISERWQHSEKLKSMVTTTERFINVKYGLQQSEVNCCRFLLNSNYESALPLQVGDRRWNVIRNPSDPLPADYYKALYWLINPRNAEATLFVASVREHLLRRDLSAFNPGARAALNDAKRDVIAASMTHEDEKAAELVKNCTQEVVTADQLFWFIFGFQPATGDDETSRKWRLLGPIAAKATIEKLREFTWKGIRYKTWALRNPQRWKTASTDELARELRLEQ